MTEIERRLKQAEENENARQSTGKGTTSTQTGRSAASSSSGRSDTERRLRIAEEQDRQAAKSSTWWEDYKRSKRYEIANRQLEKNRSRDAAEDEISELFRNPFSSDAEWQARALQRNAERYKRDSALYQEAMKNASTSGEYFSAHRQAVEAQSAVKHQFERYQQAAQKAEQDRNESNLVNRPAQWQAENLSPQEIERRLAYYRSEAATPTVTDKDREARAYLYPEAALQKDPHGARFDERLVEDAGQDAVDAAYKPILTEQEKAAVEEADQQIIKEKAERNYEQVQRLLAAQKGQTEMFTRARGNELIEEIAQGGEAAKQVETGRAAFEAKQQQIASETSFEIGDDLDSNRGAYNKMQKERRERGYILGYDWDNVPEDRKQAVYALYAEDPKKAIELAKFYIADVRQAEDEERQAWYAQSGWTAALGLVSSAAAHLGAAVDPFGDVGQELTRRGDNALAGGSQWADAATGYQKIPEWVPIVGGKGAGDFYQTVGSVVQSAAVAAPAILAGRYDQAGAEVLSKLGLALMGSSAAASDYRESVAAGMDEDRAKLHALAAGVEEALFEEVSLDKLIKMDTSGGLKAALKNWLVQSGIEGSEELATSIANRFTDEMISGAGQSKVERRASELIANGMSSTEAHTQAESEWMTDTLYEGFSGFLSGGMMTGGDYALQGLANLKERAVSAVETRKAQKQAGAAVSRSEGSVEALQAYAKDNGIEIKGVETAEQNAEQGEQGATKNSYSSRDYRSISDTNSKVTQSIRNEVRGKTVQEQQTIRDNLVEKYGEGIAPVVNQAISVETAARVRQEYGNVDSIQAARNRAVSEIKDESLRRAVSDGYDSAAYSLAASQGGEGGMNTMSRYIQQRKNTGSGAEMTMNATVTAQDGSTKSIAITGMSEDGKRVSLADGSEVAVKDLQADADTTSAIQQLADLDLGDDATKVLQAYQQSGVSGTDGYRWLMDYATAYNQGRTRQISLEQAAKRSSLDERTVMDAYTLGQQAANRETQAGLEKLKNLPKRKGANGRTANIDTTEIRGKTMSKSELEQFELANQYAQALGVDMTWFSSREKDGKFIDKNGAYENGKIYMDIHAGRNFAADLTSGILATMGHELTHFQQQYAPEEYQALKEFLFEQIVKSSPNGEARLERLIWEKQRRSGYTLSRKAAEDEVVADACQKMLRDSKVVHDFASQQPEAANSLVRWLDKWFKRVRSIFGRGGNYSEEAQIMDSLEQDVKAAFGELWDKALKQAVQVHDEVGNIKEESKAQNSDRDAEYLELAKDPEKNATRLQEMVDEAARKAGYTIKAYHGTTEDFTEFSRGKQGQNYNGYLEFGAGFYFTPSEKEARSWAERGKNGPARAKDSKVMGVYLNPGRIIEADAAIPGGVEYLQSMGLTKADAAFVANRTYRFIDYLLEDKGYSNVEVQEQLKSMGFDAAKDTYRNDTEGQYVVFDPEQIKSADPVTYDDSGNVIPLSERFNEANEDIRFSERPNTDSTGRELSDGQQEYFKDSKIRDKYGNLLTLYHGTASDFTVFDLGRSGKNYDGWSEYGIGIYLTPDKKFATYFSESASQRGGTPKLMELYVNIKNPFNVNDPVTVDVSEYAKKYKLTEDDVKFLKKSGDRWLAFMREHNEDIYDFLTSHGYDGLWDAYGTHAPTQIVAFTENQVKNADNLNPTDNPDIRYSERDTEYLDAVDRGDMETAKRLVEEAARKAGYTVEGYHGTPDFGFTVLDVSKSDDKISFFVTSSVETARTYSGVDGTRGISEDVDQSRDLTKAVFNLISDAEKEAGVSGIIDKDNAAKGIIEAVSKVKYSYEEQNIASREINNVLEQIYDAAEIKTPFHVWLFRNYRMDSGLLTNQYDAVVSEAMLYMDRARGDINEGNYRVFIDPTNLLEIDGGGAKWNEIEFAPTNDSNGYSKTRDIAKWAKDNGYSGVLFKGIVDDGGIGRQRATKPSDVYALFKPQAQVKSADPVTYDDSGNVIPLSERFNAKNEDIRYSERDELASDNQIHDITNRSGETVGVQDGNGHVQFSQRTWRESGKEKMQEYLDERVRKYEANRNDPEGMHPDDAKALMDAVQEQYDALDEIVRQQPGNYKTYEEWADAEVETDIFGNPVFSWLKANGDYGISGDASLICVKRRTLDAVFDYMIRENMIQDGPEGLKLAQESIVAINDIIRAHGFETACSTCYIDARRYRAAIVAGSFCNVYNKLVRSMLKGKTGVPINAFNFGGNKSVTPLANSLDTLPDSEINWDGINKAIRDQEAKWESKGWEKFTEDGEEKWRRNGTVKNLPTSGTTEYRIALALKEKPSLRKLALRSDFLSGNGFLELNRTNKDILTLYNVKKGQAGPKATETDIQYLHEALENSFITPDRMFKAGGFRLQSFSDYVPRLVFDYVEIIGDLAAKGVPAHMYTKEILCVLQHGLTGTKINMSLIPAMVKKGIAPGLDADGNYLWRDGQTFGSTAYSLSPKLEAHLSKILGYQVKGRLTGAQGFELAKLIQNDPAYGKNNGTIAIGVSEAQIRKMLDDADIRMVIPYHKSGLNHILASMMEIPGFENYESYQNTLKWNGTKWSKVDVDFDFNEAVQKHKGDARAAAQDYLDWCNENGYKPKFSGVASGSARNSYNKAYDFTQHADWQTGEMTGEAERNYYKVLADFTCYDAEGKVSRQEAVKLNYPGTDSAFGSMKQLIEMGLESDAMLQAKQDAEVPKIVADIVREIPKFEAAGRNMKAYAQLKENVEGRQYSERDYSTPSDEELLMQAKAEDAESPEARTALQNSQKQARQIRDLTRRLERLQAEIRGYEGDSPNRISVQRFRQQALDLFGIPSGVRTDMGELLQSVAEGVLAGHNLSQNDIMYFFETLITNGREKSVADETLAEIRDDLKGRKIYVNENVKAEFGDDWNAFRKRAFSLGIQLTNNEKNMGIDTVNAELAEFYPGKFDANETDLRSILENIVDTAESGKTSDVPILDAMREVQKQTGEPVREQLQTMLDQFTRQIEIMQDQAAVERKARAGNAAEIAKARKQINEAKEALREVRKQRDAWKRKSEGADARQKRALDAALRGVVQHDAKQIAEAVRQKQALAKKLQDQIDHEKKILSGELRSPELVKMLKAEREKAEARVKEQKEQVFQNYKERKKAGELRRRIVRHSKELYGKLTKPSDKRHIPEAYRGAVAALLNTINLESAYDIQEGTKNESGRGGKHVEKGTGTATNRTKAFQEVRKQLEKVLAEGGFTGELINNAAEGFDGGLIEKCQDFADKPISTLSSEELETLWNTIRALEHNIATFNKAFALAKTETISGIADKFLASAQKRKPLLRDPKSRLDLTVKKTSGIAMKALENPYTFFSHYGEEGVKLFRALRDTQDLAIVRTYHLADLWVSKMTDILGDEKTANLNGDKLTDAILDKIRDTSKQMDEKVETFKLDNGQTITLTHAMLMDVYLLSQRGEVGMNHLLGSGLIQPEIRAKGKYVARDPSFRKLSLQDVQKMTEVITENATEKAIADAIQSMQHQLADWGNEASMDVFGYRKFTEDNYWPVKNAKEENKSDSGKGGNQPANAMNKGMAKNLVPHAATGMEPMSAFTKLQGSISDMLVYATWGPVMEDFKRFYNWKWLNPEGGTSDTVKGVMERYGGEGSQRYWEELRDQINNGVGGGKSFVDQFIGKAVGVVKGARVAFNLRVVAQQPTAYARAAEVISGKYLAASLLDIKSWGWKAKSAWNRALTHSPIAMRKDSTTYDMGGNISAGGEFGLDRPGRLDKARDFGTALAGKADAITWGRLWHAAELQVSAKTELEYGSQEYWDAVNKLFTDAVDRTQVVDGLLQRPAIMRTDSDFVKGATSYMGEPLMQLNMLMRQVNDFRQTGFKATKKQIGKTVTALVVTQLINAMLTGLYDAGIRKDDKDKDFWERFMAEITGLDGTEENAWDYITSVWLESNVASEVSVMQKIPLVKDVLSMLQGYDPSNNRMDLEAIKDLIDVCTKVLWNDNYTPLYKAKEMINKASMIFGAGFGNALKDMYGVTRNIINDFGKPQARFDFKALWLNPASKKNKSQYFDLLFQMLENGDKDAFRQRAKKLAGQDGMLQYVAKAAIERYLTDGLSPADVWDMMEAARDDGMSDEKFYDYAHGRMADAIKKSYLNRKLEDDQAITLLMKYAGKDEQTAWKKVQEWADKAEHTDEEGELEDGYEYSVYNDLFKAVDANQDAEKVIKDMVQNGGYEADSLRGKIKEHLRERFIAGEITETALKNQLSRYCKIVNTKDVNEIVANAKCKRDFGVYPDALKEAFKDGDLSQNQAVKALQQYNGLSKTDAQNLVQYWNYDGDLSESAWLKWNNELKRSGLSVENWEKVSKVKSDAKGTDANGDGKADYGTAKAEVVSYIDSMNIPKSQKKAIYLAFGWAASTMPSWR